jgi:hypothetical protein
MFLSMTLQASMSFKFDRALADRGTLQQ